MSVLVMDASGNHALAVVRSLGRRGVRVAAAGETWCAQSFLSRHCARRFLYSSPERGIREFRAALGRILARARPAMVMPMTERTILALLTGPDGIGSQAALAPFPPRESLRVAFDKSETLWLAASLGVAVPRTWSFARLPDFEVLRSRLTYPAVIKPRRSEIVTVDGRIVPSGPVAYCFGPERLEALFLEVHRRAPLPLVQEYIPGDGYGISALCDRGRIRALFAHRRLRMIQPTGSGSSLRESVAPPPAMAEAARRLLEALRWHGVAMVEFKLDARDGAPRLMEINGRFWNSLPLAVAAGVDFPFLLYRLGIEGTCPERFDYRVGVRSRWLAGDARHLLAVLRGRPAGWTDPFPPRLQTLREFMRLGGRDLHYDELQASDPGPLLAELVEALLRQVPRRLASLRSPAVEEAPGSPFDAGGGPRAGRAGRSLPGGEKGADFVPETASP